MQQRLQKQEQDIFNNNNNNSTNATSVTNTTTTLHNRTFRTRTCSSIDILTTNASDTGDCFVETTRAIIYPEIRFLGMNWESIFFETWIVQILLSELLGVPTSVETSVFDKSVDFYDQYSRFDYGKPYDYDAFRIASQLDTCTGIVQQQINNLSVTEDNYISCAQVGMEFWLGQKLNLHQLEQENIIEKPVALGALGQAGWYVPRFTIERDPTVLNFLGLSGERNRQKLASLFLRPTTWYDYCTQISTTNCTIPDTVAQRPPVSINNDNDIEGTRMFFEGSYTGYFRNTTDNDCILYPNNCTGHIADLPCGWTSFVMQQTHHLNIALKSSGPEAGSNGYSYTQLVDIWAAANATKSNVMMMWWTPEPLVQQYMGTESEFLRVTLPPATQQCLDNRVNSIDRCSDNIQLQYGTAAGSCDDEPSLLYKVNTKRLQDTIYDPNKHDAERSPAYDAIRNFQITGLQLGVIFDKWISKQTDKWGYDPRDAVCEWVYENIDLIESFIPRTYPRSVQDSTIERLYSPFFYVAIIFGILSMLLVLATSVAIYFIRKRKVIVIAQIEFLSFLLFGLLLVQISSLILLADITTTTCTLIPWFNNIGVTLELVPLLVKVAAINRLMSAAIRLKRVRIDRKHMLGVVLCFLLLTIGYLLTWTLLYPPRMDTSYSLVLDEDNISDDGNAIIKSFNYCNYETSFWQLIALIWRSILLFSATVLAFQSRNSPININESKALALMVYAKFVCLLLTFVLFIVSRQLPLVQLHLYESLIQSLDVACVCGIYFVPKLKVTDEDLAKASVMYSGHLQSSSFGGIHNHHHGSASTGFFYSEPGPVGRVGYGTNRPGAVRERSYSDGTSPPSATNSLATSTGKSSRRVIATSDAIIYDPKRRHMNLNNNSSIAESTDNEELTDFSENFRVLVEAAKKRRRNEMLMLEKKSKSVASFGSTTNNTRSTRRLLMNANTNISTPNLNLRWNTAATGRGRGGGIGQKGLSFFNIRRGSNDSDRPTEIDNLVGLGTTRAELVLKNERDDKSDVDDNADNDNNNDNIHHQHLIPVHESDDEIFDDYSETDLERQLDVVGRELDVLATRSVHNTTTNNINNGTSTPTSTTQLAGTAVPSNITTATTSSKMEDEIIENEKHKPTGTNTFTVT